MLARQLIPGKAGVLFAPHQKAAVAFRYLRKHLGVVLFALVVYIDAGLRPRKADVHVAGKHRGAHHFVRAAAVGKLHVQPLVREEALCQRHILRRIENGIQSPRTPSPFAFPFVLPLQPARAVSARHTHRRSAKPFFIYYHPFFFIGKPGAFRRAYSPCLRLPSAPEPAAHEFLQQHHALVHQRRHHGQNEHAGHHEVQLKHLPAVYDQIPQPGLADEELARNNAHQ